MRFSAIRYALRNRNSSSTGAVINPRSFFQSIPLSPLPRRLPWVISMGESAMKFKVKREERRRRTLSENNAFGYFGHTRCPLLTPVRFPDQEQRAPALSFAALVTGIILLSGMLYWVMRW